MAWRGVVGGNSSVIMVCQRMCAHCSLCEAVSNSRLLIIASHLPPTLRLDLNDIRIVTKSGGTIDDSEMVDGIVFDQKAAKAAGGPSRMEKAKVGCGMASGGFAMVLYEGRFTLPSIRPSIAIVPLFAAYNMTTHPL